jgi:hypothetical protein
VQHVVDDGEVALEAHEIVAEARPSDDVLQELVALSEHPQSGRGSGRAADLIRTLNVGAFHEWVGGLGRVDEVCQPAVVGVLTRRGSGDPPRRPRLLTSRP